MLFIQKGEEPPEQRTERIKIQHSAEWKCAEEGDTAAIRACFDQLPKDIIRNSLIKEQKGLCAYCMRRLEPDGFHTQIEHWYPLSRDKSKALSYSNMLGVCDGGKSSDHRKKVLCCDASKNDETEMAVNPLDFSQMQQIAYLSDGTIYTVSKDKKLEKDLNETLKLNGKLDKTGRRTADTATCLVKNRRDAYEQSRLWLRKLDKVNKCTSAMVGKKIEEIMNAPQLPEYAGVTLFVLKKKQLQLQKRGL